MFPSVNICIYFHTQVGLLGVTVAIVGSILPLGLGFGISYAYGYDIKV